jgi:hypothetical protein
LSVGAAGGGDLVGTEQLERRMVAHLLHVTPGYDRSERMRRLSGSKPKRPRVVTTRGHAAEEQAGALARVAAVR